MPSEQPSRSPSQTKPRPTRSQPRGENAGALVYQSDRVNGLLSSDVIDSVIVYRFKAERSLYREHGVTQDMLNALLIVSRFLTLTAKDGAGLDRLVSFSGNARGWKAKMYAAMRGNIALGIFERVTKPGGGSKQVKITAKGQAIRRQFYDKINEIHAALQDPQQQPKDWYSHAGQVA